MVHSETLRSGWTKVKFGEVVRLCKDRSSDPEADGIERYVGLEHLEPEDLRIRSWGLVADGTTFTSRFKPGQVLFGKRRAYQRKVAVADFEGVCSGDIYVFESLDPKYLLPELLPYKPEYWDGEIPWIKTGEVNFNSIKSTEEHITQAGLKNSSSKLAPINSVIMALFGQGPTLGRVAILDIEATTNQACAIIRPEEGCNMRFVYYALWRQYERVRAKARGASQPNINASIVKSLEIPYISIEEQNSWVDKLDDQLSAMRSIDERIEGIAHLKKRMLNKLFG